MLPAMIIGSGIILGLVILDQEADNANTITMTMILGSALLLGVSNAIN